MKKAVKPVAKKIISGRTRFARDIVAEFWMPVRPSGKAIILCDGCPSVPSKGKLGEYLARKGFWVFHPRYRGSWESGGHFLKYAPEEDVRLVAEGLNRGFQNVYDGQTYILDIRETFVFGVSFGGAAAILSTKYPIITKAVALSPVIDWHAKSKAEPFTYFTYLLEAGFGEGYRVHKDAWKKILGGHFYNPIDETDSIDPKKLFIMHAKDDEVVPIRPLKRFAALTKTKPLILEEGGHLSSSLIRSREVWKKINDFLKK